MTTPVPYQLWLFLILVLLLSGAGAQPVQAQSSALARGDSTHRYGWVSVGVAGSRTGVGGSIVAGLPVGETIFLGGRYLHTKQVRKIFAPGPSETAWDSGLLVGGVRQGRVGHLALASGVVVVGGKRRVGLRTVESASLGCLLFCGEQEYEMRRVRTVGLPIDVQAVLTLSPYAGLGVHGYAAVTPDENRLGISVQVMVRIPR